MAELQVLSSERAREVIQAAADRGLEVLISLQIKNRWVSYSSLAVALEAECLWLHGPRADDNSLLPEFAVGRRLSISFDARRHRYFFPTTVQRIERIVTEDRTNVFLLGVNFPREVHQLERRGCARVPIPSSVVARVSFWVGGRDLEPSQNHPDVPSWSGRLIDLSDGGFCMRTIAEAAKYLKPGDVANARLTFCAEQETVYLDAQFRYACKDGNMALLGFQFMHTGTEEDRATHEFIKRKVGQLLP